MTGSLSEAQLDAIGVVTRAAGSVALVASLFVLLTFTFIPDFRMPVNRLIFYASFTNLFNGIAAVIAQSGRRAGSDSKLCQAQAFFIAWSQPADVYWVFAMAVNCLLAFFMRFDTRRLQKLEPLYMTICYGVSFVDALALLFVHSEKRGHVYGDAQVWCFINGKWSFLRYAFLYGPVWISIATVAVIFTAVGVKIYSGRLGIRRIAKKTRHSAQQPGIKVVHEVYVNATSSSASTDKSTDGSLIEAGSNGVLPPTPVLHGKDRSLSYVWYAGLYTFVLLATWLPPTINRTYGLTTRDRQNFGLSMGHGFALSLQGLWNAIIYIIVSWHSLPKVWSNLKGMIVKNSG